MRTWIGGPLVNEKPKDTVEELIDVLVLRRKQLEWTKPRVAELIGCSPGLVGAVEAGVVDPSCRFLLAYAHAVDIELTWTVGARK